MFTAQELKIIKYNLMKNYNYTKEEARAEIEGMIEITKENHKKALAEKKKAKLEEKKGIGVPLPSHIYSSKV